GDAREVMALAQHLRADQGACLSAPKALQDGHERALAARRVAIENVGGHVGKITAETLLHLLRPEANRLQHLAVAERAARRDRLAQPAVVTDEQTGAAMNRERNAAVAAAELVTTFAAQQIRRVSPATDEDDGLLAGVEGTAQRLVQLFAEDDEALVVLLRALATQIDDFRLRKR